MGVGNSTSYASACSTRRAERPCFPSRKSLVSFHQILRRTAKAGQTHDNVERAEVFEECGHSLALEAEDRLANFLREFMLER